MKCIRLLVAAVLVSTLVVPRVVLAEGEVKFGTQNWWQTANEAKLQEFGEFPNGAYLENFLVTGKVGSFAGNLWGTDLFLNNQAMGLSFDKGIRWQLDGSYQQQPHLFSLIARSPFTDQGAGAYRLPDSLQRANQEDPGGYVNRMTSELAVAPYIPLSHRTNVSDARLRVRPSRGLQLELNAEQRARTGTKQYAMSFGFSNANEITEPINQRMTDVSAAANYGRGGVKLRALVGYSRFDNKIDALVLDNPRRYTDSPTTGSSSGRLDLYPDNHAVRAQFDLGARLNSMFRYSGTLGLARLEQDDPWLPFTINSAISPAAVDSLYGSVTARSTDGRALRFTQNHSFTARVTDRVKGVVRFRQQHYDNETEQFPFRGVVQYDQSLVRDTVGFINRPFGNQQITVGTDWDARVADGVNVVLGYDYRWREHTYREVENDVENEIRGKVFADLESGIHAAAGASFASRRLDELLLEDYRRADAPDTVYIENPLLRRFDVADRDRTDANGELGYMVNEQLDVTVSGDYQRSDYLDSRLGLQNDERWSVLGQLAYTPSTVLSLTGGYGFGRTDTDQGSQERTTAGTTIPIRDGNLEAGTDWTALIRDRNDFGFVQSTWQVVPRSFKLVANYWVSRDQVKYLLDNETNTAIDLPDTYYLRQEGRLEAHYKLPDGTDLIGKYGYDTWKVDDFAAQDIPLLGVAGASPTATAIYLGAGYQKYTAHSLAIGLSRKF